MNDNDQTMPDERFARQLARFLRHQRHEAKQSQQNQVNADLAPVEGAFQQMRTYEVRRSIVEKEIRRLAVAITECEEQHVSYTQELAKWQLTFESALNTQKIDLASRLTALMFRNKLLMETPPPETEGSEAQDAAWKAEQLAVTQQIGELKLKLSRMKALLAWKSEEPVTITIHPPSTLDEIAFLQPNAEITAAMVCANKSCGRVKINRVHPLCRGCQRLYKEGKISGEWTGIIPPDEDAE